MGMTITYLYSLIIRVEHGFTPTGRVSYKHIRIPYVRADVTKEEVTAAIDVMRITTAGEITDVWIETTKVTRVWGPEMRERKEEQELEEAKQNDAKVQQARVAQVAGAVSTSATAAGVMQANGAQAGGAASMQVQVGVPVASLPSAGVQAPNVVMGEGMERAVAAAPASRGQDRGVFVAPVRGALLPKVGTVGEVKDERLEDSDFSLDTAQIENAASIEESVTTPPAVIPGSIRDPVGDGVDLAPATEIEEKQSSSFIAEKTTAPTPMRPARDAGSIGSEPTSDSELCESPSFSISGFCFDLGLAPPAVMPASEPIPSGLRGAASLPEAESTPYPTGSRITCGMTAGGEAAQPVSSDSLQSVDSATTAKQKPLDPASRAGRIKEEAEHIEEKPKNMGKGMTFMDKPSFWERVHDFFIDGSYKNFVPAIEEEKPASSAAQEAPTRSMELLPGETDLSYLVKDWDWNDSSTWRWPEGAAEEMGYAPQDSNADSQEYMSFKERMKANNYRVTLEEMTRSPFANTSAYKNHLTPFTDLDPLIYGEQVQ